MKEPWKYPRWYQRILNLYRFRRGRTIYACSSHPNASDENSGRSMREPKATIVGAIDACRLDRGDEVVVWTGHTEHGTVPCSERPMITFTKNMIAFNENESDADLKFETAYVMPTMRATAPTIFRIGIMLSDIDPDMIDAFLKMKASKIMIGTPIKIKCM